MIEQRWQGRVVLRGEVRGGCLVAELCGVALAWAHQIGLSSAKEGARRVYDVPAVLIPDLLAQMEQPKYQISTDAIREHLRPLLDLAVVQRVAYDRVNANVHEQGEPVADDVLMPFQKAGVGWLLAKDGVGLVGDDMGLGKTAQALAWMRHAGVRRAIVVAPASVALNWAREATRFCPGFHARVALKQADMDKLLASPPPDPSFVVVTWDGLRRMWASLLALKADAIVADEAHYAKSLDAQRTRALVWVGSSLKHRVLLSGTPMRNRPRELFPLLHLLDPARFPAFVPYGERYCGPKLQRFGARHVRTYDGATNTGELNLLLRAYMIRRTKMEVLHDLPPKRVQRLPLPTVPAIQRSLKAAMHLLRVEQHEGGNRGLGLITQIRQEVGLAKVEAAVEWIQGLREAEEPGVVFTHHLSVLEALVAACRENGWTHARIAGDTPAALRQEAVNDFQAGRVDLMLATEAAREGITLTRAANLLFVEYFWVNGDMSQASDRIWRIGQHRDVLVTILHLEGSLDDHVAKLLDRKGKIIDAVQDNRSIESELVSALLRDT